VTDSEKTFLPGGPLRPAKPTEADLQAYGTQLLELDGWRAIRTDPVSDRFRGKGFGEKGMADCLYIRYQTQWRQISGMNVAFNVVARAEVLWIEWKCAGGKAKPHQLAWIEDERARGALVLLAGESFQATPEAFFEYYRSSGLMQRDIR